MTLKVNVNTICNNCNSILDIPKSIIKFHIETTHEREMGNEKHYIAEFYYECENCSSQHEVKLEVWEYPECVINHKDSSFTGCEIEKFECEFIEDVQSHEQDIDKGENGNRILGSVAGGAILGASLGGPLGLVLGGIIGGVLGDFVNKSNKDGDNNG